MKHKGVSKALLYVIAKEERLKQSPVQEKIASLRSQCCFIIEAIETPLNRDKPKLC